MAYTSAEHFTLNVYKLAFSGVTMWPFTFVLFQEDLIKIIRPQSDSFLNGIDERGGELN